MLTKIHIISTSASENSVSRNCVSTLIDSLASNDVVVTQTDIRNLQPVWVDDRDLEEYPQEYQDLFKTIKESHAVIFTLPIYNYTVSSPAKAVSEIIGDALEKKPVGFLAAAGSMRSHLAIADFMKSMMFEQETLCFPNYVMVTKNDLADNLPKKAVAKRIKDFSIGFLEFVKLNLKNK